MTIRLDDVRIKVTLETEEAQRMLGAASDPRVAPTGRESQFDRDDRFDQRVKDAVRRDARDDPSGNSRGRFGIGLESPIIGTARAVASSIPGGALAFRALEAFGEVGAPITKGIIDTLLKQLIEDDDVREWVQEQVTEAVQKFESLYIKLKVIDESILPTLNKTLAALSAKAVLGDKVNESDLEFFLEGNFKIEQANRTLREKVRREVIQETASELGDNIAEFVKRKMNQ